MIWEIQINSGVSELNSRYDVSSNVTMFCNDTKLKILSGFKIAKSSRKVLRAAGEKNQYTTSLSSTSRYCLISQAGRKHTVVFNYLLI